jgi:glycosyltransferase involved in cell wall biosynthesis
LRHSDAELTVLLLDGAKDAGDGPEDFSVVLPDDLGMPGDLVAKLMMACTAAELAEALTPRLVRLLVEQGAPAVVAFPPETEVFAGLDHVVDLAVEHGIVLVPRLDGSVPDDGLEPDPGQLRAAGTFASEFVAVGGDGAAFLEWWSERQTAVALSRGGFDTAGPWTAEVTAMFPVHVLRDPGCGVSAWNLHARELRSTDSGYEVSGGPLRWFDFSGASPERPHLLSTAFERPRVRLSNSTALARLCDEHAAHLRTAGYHADPPAYGHDSLPDGKEIDARMRRIYVDALRDAAEQGEPEPPSPFGPEGPDAFETWLMDPVAPPPDPRVSRYLARVWAEVPTVRHVYPSLAGEAAERFLGWTRIEGKVDQQIPEWVLPSEDDVMQLMKRRWQSRPAGPWQQGVNVVGYVTAVLGVGHVARVLASTLDAAAVAKVVVANKETVSEKSLPFDTRAASDAAHDVNLLCVNADHTPFLAEQLGPEFFAGRRTIGVWFWEVESFPPPPDGAFDVVDEVWVASDFVLESIAPVAPKPVRKFPLPVVVPTPPADVTRAQLELPDDRFMFLFVYDFLSTAERKNPVGLIEAYTRAFGPDEGTVLVLKSINGDKRVEQLERVRRAAEGRPDVIVRDAYLSPDLHAALLAQSDAYVSLHRSEGFGLDMASAMGMGKPVIATGYSGNLDFMDDDTAYLVDYDLELVGPGSDPYPPESRWAAPRLDHAAELMRRVVERPEEARERGRRAEARIRTDFSLDARSGALARMVDEARSRGIGPGSWRRLFTEPWRLHGNGVDPRAYSALWLPDGTPVDPIIRSLLDESERDATRPDPEGDLDGFYCWLKEPVFPPQAPVVSRYLYRLWSERPDLQALFPSLDLDPRSYLEWVIRRGHPDTDIPYRLFPTGEDMERLTRHEERQERRERVAAALRSARQRAARMVNRR